MILLRDLHNTAASIARSAADNPSFAHRFRILDLPHLWRRYALYHLDPPPGWLPVQFNRWVDDPSYRAGLQKELGLPAIEAPTDTVSAIGGGSSFDGTAFDGRASHMEVKDRWRAMEADRLFQFLLLAEESALDLNHSVFGNTGPDRASFLERWGGR